jgi:adenylate cyclase
VAAEEERKNGMIDEAWRIYLTTGDVPDFVGAPWYHAKRLRPLFRHLPADPRCRLCYYPFEGIGGVMMRHVFGVVPSKLNPHLCNLCEEFAEKYKGGAEIELTILFADVRGSTHLAETMKPKEFSQLINRFYNATTKILFDSGALVEKLIGDEVTGFYTPGFSGLDHARVAVEAARAIQTATGPWIPVGIGVHTGLAYVGSVNSDSGVTNIAVLGDTANTGARLASAAGAGEALISQATAAAAGLEPSGMEMRRLELKGRSEPIEVWVLGARERATADDRRWTKDDGR